MSIANFINFIFLKPIQKLKLQRSHAQVLPMVILVGVITILMFLPILSFTLYGLMFVLTVGLLYGYFFFVMISLYNLFKKEHEVSQNNQNQLKMYGTV